MPAKIPDEIKDGIINDYLAGSQIATIAQTFSCSPRTVSKVARAALIPLRPVHNKGVKTSTNLKHSLVNNKITKEMLCVLIREHVDGGKSIWELARTFAVSERTLATKIRKEGIKLNPYDIRMDKQNIDKYACSQLYKDGKSISQISRIFGSNKFDNYYKT